MRMSRNNTVLLLSTIALMALPVFAARAEPIKVGQPAPEIELPATTGGEIKLSDFRGKKMVLVEFYHTDWGPTCMANLEARRDEYDKFEELNIQVLGISLDHAYSQAAFADSIELPYPLLSDYPNGRTVKDYGVDYYEGQAERLFARPSFFLVDMEGVVRGYWGQRPKNSDEILAPDPLISSAPMLEAAQQIAAMSLSLLKFVGQASLVDEAMLPS